MLIIPYTCNCASKSTTGQFWWWLGQSHGLLDLRRKAERMRHRSETSVKSKWHRSETAVKSKGNRSDIKVNSKWNRSDIKVKSKWDQSELEVISKLNRSEIRVNSQWYRSEFEVKSKWARSELEVKSNWAPPPPTLLSNLSWPYRYIYWQSAPWLFCASGTAAVRNHAPSTGPVACLFVCLLHHGLAVYIQFASNIFKLPTTDTVCGFKWNPWAPSIMRALLKNESFVILPIFDWRAMGTHSYSDISQCRKECEMMHNNDFEILRKRLVDCEEKLQKAKNRQCRNQDQWERHWKARKDIRWLDETYSRTYK